MGGALLLAAAVGSLAVFGWTLATRLGIDAPAFRCLAAYVLAWVGLVGAALALSLPGWLGGRSLALSTALLAAAGLTLVRHTRRGPVTRVDPAWRQTLADPVVLALTVAVAAGGVYLAALAFLTTPNDWDGLTYHETRALLWDQQGRVGYVPSGNDPRLDGNPPVSEVGLYLSMLLPRSERFAALPSFIALWASVLTVVLLARRLGLSRVAASYGGLMFATLPVVLLHGAAVLNDLVVASFLLAAVVFLAGRSSRELALGSVALGLALSTKFSAALAVPIVVAAVLALVPRGRRRPSILACGAGLLLGAPWYVLNLIETHSLDGGLGDSTGQTADHSAREVLGTLRSLTFDIVDTSGFWGSELYLVGAVGAALVLLAAARPGTTGAGTLVRGAIVITAAPLLLRAAERPARSTRTHFWSKLGQDGVALDHGTAWHVLGLPDTSLSWYGVAGTVLIFGGVVAAIVGVRRGQVRAGAVLLAIAPLLSIVVFAFTIVYDPWRGRLAMFAVGLACAAWGWTIRIRWLSAGIAALSVTTVVLSLIHSYTKPAGFGILEPSISRSVWYRDRIDTLTVIRDYDGAPALLRAVERDVPADAYLAMATPIDTFLAPLAGPRLSRTLRPLADGSRVPSDAAWLVAKGPSSAAGCPSSWAPVYQDAENRWRLLRRTAPDACGNRTAPL